MSTSSRYCPGLCNIDQEERGRRYWAAAVGAVVTAASFAVVVSFGPYEGLLLGMFVPAALTAEAALQASLSFCVSLAYRSRHAVDGVGQVTDAGARRTVRVHGAVITAAGVAIGAVVTGLAFGLAVQSSSDRRTPGRGARVTPPKQLRRRSDTGEA